MSVCLSRFCLFHFLPFLDSFRPSPALPAEGRPGPSDDNDGDDDYDNHFDDDDDDDLFLELTSAGVGCRRLLLPPC